MITPDDDIMPYKKKAKKKPSKKSDHKHQYAKWTKWEREFKDINQARKLMPIFMQDMEYWMFIQFKFYEQWNKLKEYANLNNIQIIGDLPIYVSSDSADVWSNPNLFYLLQTSIQRHLL